jgi:hypothetical protein
LSRKEKTLWSIERCYCELRRIQQERLTRGVEEAKFKVDFEVGGLEKEE